MASIFKRKRKVKQPNGKIVVKKSIKYYTRLTDADGVLRTISLFKDKTASQQQAAKLQKEASSKKFVGFVGLRQCSKVVIQG